MENCIFCRIIQKQLPSTIIYEDEHMLVFPDIHPKARVHLLCVTQKHIPSLLALSPGDEIILAHLLKQLPILAKQQGLEGFKTVIHTGKSGGQEIFHLHIHLLGA